MFGPQISKFIVLGSLVSLSGSMTALILHNNLDVAIYQPISILEALVPITKNLTVRSITNDFINSVRYKTFASVIRQLEKPTNCSTSKLYSMSSKLSSNIGSTWKHQFFSHNNNRNIRKINNRAVYKPNRNLRSKLLTCEQVQDLKLNSQCPRCIKYGHLYNYVERDGRLNCNII